MTKISVAERKSALEKRMAELDDRLHRIEGHLEEAPNPDWEENAQETENNEVLEELGHVGADELKTIQAALERVEAGTYGDCVKCGSEIAEERLDLLPATPFCKDCA